MSTLAVQTAYTVPTAMMEALQITLLPIAKPTPDRTQYERSRGEVEGTVSCGGKDPCIHPYAIALYNVMVHTIIQIRDFRPSTRAPNSTQKSRKSWTAAFGPT